MTDPDTLPEHPIVLRGAGAVLWGHITAAINEGIEPPAELVAEGRAGTSKSFGFAGGDRKMSGRFAQACSRSRVITERNRPQVKKGQKVLVKEKAAHLDRDA